ncbi:MAG TPA: right-handed parallel beta-helix repeat-containing protein [Chryseosolibacter sp.]|nr:right-handed parallel beta-helix repeat-containing protein [Chryseosolibacter sp.]
MINTHFVFKAMQKVLLAVTLLSVINQCAEENITPNTAATQQTIVADSTDSQLRTSASSDCNCDYVVPADSTVVDGKVLALKPGSVVCLNSAFHYGTLEFHNLEGTEADPIIIRNCGGPVTIKATDKWHALKTINSKYFRITGGDASGVYGIRIQGGEMGMKLDGLSTNFEVDHVEVSNVSFAGIMAKTDPGCDDATIRGNFTMYDVRLHDNYVHDTGGEGFYIGNSFFDGMQRECGLRLPHLIKGLKVYNNVIRNSGWESIQVGCAIEGTEIYNNTIENYGAANIEYQDNGIQIGSGTGGAVYNNFIKKGNGNGLIVMGTGDNVIYNNIIVDAGLNGIFCDERYTPGEGFTFINNTIISPKMYGIRLYSEKVPMNTVINNIISNPGALASRDSANAFVARMNDKVHVEMANNLFVNNLDTLQFMNPAADNYRLKAASPAVNLGKDISSFRIDFDFYENRRLRGVAYDIGASEF